MDVSPSAIRGVEAELQRLRRENERLWGFLREVYEHPYPFTQSDYAYCFFCDVVGVYRDDGWVIDHTPDCWLKRVHQAAAATDEQEMKL